MVNFSLLDENWIPVVLMNGDKGEASVLDALLNAGAYRRIDAGHPLDTVAEYRLLLAILHRALKGPQDAEQAADWYMNGFPHDKISAYLNTYADRFDLFGERPFMQVADLDPAVIGENFRSHWTRLSVEEGSSNTTALFNREARPGGDRSDDLSAAQAARLLLTHQAMTLGGLIKRFTTAAKAAPVATAALFMAEGQTLHQTLCLNLVPYLPRMAEKDLPPWEQPPLLVEDIRALYLNAGAPSKVIPGIVSRYTWPSRSVNLLPTQTPEGLRVITIGFGAGVPYEGAGEGVGQGLDPMVTLRPSRDDKSDPYPFKLARHRLTWRGLTALLPDPAAEVYEMRGKLKVKAGRAPRTLGYATEVLKTVLNKEASVGVQPPPIRNRPTSFEPEDAAAAPARPANPVIPVMMFGQLTDQGKAFAMRQETYMLPENFVQNPVAFRDHIKQALADAGQAGDGLRGSVRLLAEALLQKDGERVPHKDDVTKLADQIPAVPTFWAQLEGPFRAYLMELGTRPEEALARWHTALVAAANTGWRMAEEAAGMNSVGLRAVQVSQGPLLAALQPLRGKT